MYKQDGFHSGENSSKIIITRISVLRSNSVDDGAWEKKSDFSCLILGRSATVTFDVFINFGVLMCNKINERKIWKHNAHRKENFDPLGLYRLLIACILNNLLSSPRSLTSCRPEKVQKEII